MPNTFPYSDEVLKYNYDAHRYILTADGVKKRIGVDLNVVVKSAFIPDKTTAVNQFLDDVSDEIYAYVYSYNIDNNYQEYLMAKSPQARENLEQAMLRQIQYILTNGKIDDYIGMNMDFSQVNANHKLEDIRGARAFHPSTIRALSRRLENGQTLLFSGDYRYMLNIDNWRQDY